MNVELEHLERLSWGWVVLPAVACAVIGVVRRRRWLRDFASASLLSKLTQPVSAVRQYGRVVLMGIALFAVFIATLDPRWGEQYEEIEQRGIDVVIVLDVSRSMLAQDARPDRLSRAKEIARDLVNELRGDRVALVTAAGVSAVSCPLTVDRGAFRLAIDLADTQTAARGGSLLGDAIRVAADAFADDIPDHKAIVLLTDGEDHDSYMREAAQNVFEERGIRVFTVGIGDAETGSRIPVVVDGRRTFLTTEEGGQQVDVWSKLDENLLSEVAVVGGGAYVPVGTRTLDAGRLYREHIEPMTARTFDTAERATRAVQFHWFAATALALLVLESLLGMPRGARNTKPSSAKRRRAGRTGPVAAVLAAAMLAPGGTVHAQETDASSPRQRLRAANTALENGDFEAAAGHYAAAERAFPENAGLPYNRGVALYRLGRYREAAEAFGRAHEVAASPDSKARSAYNLGTATHAEAIEATQAAPDAANPLDPGGDDRQARVDDAISRLGEAIDHYRRALAEDPSDEDARANAELAHRLIRQLQQVPEGDSSESDPSDEEQPEDSEDQSDAQDQQGQGEPSENQQSQDQQQSEQDQPEQQSPSDQDSENDEQPQDSNPQDEESPQDEPQRDEPSEASPSPESPPDQGEAESPQESGMSREEAQRLLQRVRDRDRERQEERAARERADHQPARRDW